MNSEEGEANTSNDVQGEHSGVSQTNRRGRLRTAGLVVGTAVAAGAVVAGGALASATTSTSSGVGQSYSASATTGVDAVSASVSSKAGKSRGPGNRGSWGNGGGQSGGSHSVAIEPGSLGTASAATAAQLAYLVEEEKLAHDIYVLAGTLYSERVFDNISRSESTHQDAVRQLLAGYGLDDPSEGMAAGEFQDADLQALYDKLAKKVSKSAKKAAKVGVIIEKTDIADLRVAIAQADSSEVKQTLERLEAASQNHLKAFKRLKARS